MNERLVAATVAGFVAVLAILIGIELQSEMLAKYFVSVRPKPEVKDFGPEIVADREADFISKMAPASATSGTFGPDDPNSYARPDQCAVSNIHLSLDVDFERKVLTGSVVLSVEKQYPLASALYLDTRDLKIHDVTDAKTGEKLKYLKYASDGTFGSSLEITLPPNGSLNEQVRIKYETSPESSALQWLSPQQTAGKMHPYLFSQCQAIHARSMMPCQDTPSVKASYTAEIKAPSYLTVLMSALREKTLEDPGNENKKIHYFKQPVRIPSYLVAIAVGSLESRRIGPRSLVWSEKELIEQAEYEFGETEVMLKTGEDVMGPYIWQQYDLLVLPPSFPFGGMENPCLTFVTPTLLAGDRSLVNVIAHEIAHSWTGNLVTNKNFEHFWLNEGFTTFTERKIVGRLYGESCRHFQAILGWQDLEDSVKRQGPENPLTNLVPDLKGIDPDDAFSTVPYEKGHSLLFYLEQLLGGPEKFEPFLREYINKFQYQSIVTKDFKDFLYEYFKEQSSNLEAVDWNAWLYKPGMPPVQVNASFDATLAEACTQLAKRWIDADMFDLSEFGVKDVASFTSLQLCDFLSQLMKADPLPHSKLEVMDKAYGLSVTRNAEVKFRWVRLGIRGRWLDIVPLALDFVTTQGRMKFVRPIFRDLYLWEEIRSQAIETYQKHKSHMMYVTATMVGKDLNLVA